MGYTLDIIFFFLKGNPFDVEFYLDHFRVASKSSKCTLYLKSVEIGFLRIK